jgi:hypothetical protein
MAHSGNGFEGLLGPSGRLGIFTVPPEGKAAAFRQELQRRLFPPGKLVVDALYRATPEAIVARILVRDMDPRPGPRLSLRIAGEGRILSVRLAETGEKVLFEQDEKNLFLQPGPGAGPRLFLIEMVGVGPGMDEEEILLPTLKADPSRLQEPGLVALDADIPGRNGALTGTSGVSLDRDSEEIDEALRDFWGETSYLVFRALQGPVQLSISTPKLHHQIRLPELSVESLLTPDLGLRTRLRFSLPEDSAWMALGLMLPPGTRNPTLIQGSKPTPLVREVPDSTRADELPIRLQIPGDGTPVYITFQGSAQLKEGTLELALPTPDQELGKLTWQVEVPEDLQLGVPFRLAPPSSEPAASTSHSTTESVGPSQYGFGSRETIATPPSSPKESEKDSETSGNRVTFRSNGILPGDQFKLLIPTVEVLNLTLGHTLLFLAGLLGGLWGILGRPVGGAFLGLPASAVLFALGGAFLARVHEIHSPWAQAVLGGALFSLLLLLIAWGFHLDFSKRPPEETSSPEKNHQPGTSPPAMPKKSPAKAVPEKKS